MNLYTALSEIKWIAGFLEGEGSFQFRRGCSVSAAQVELFPLSKLQAILGGSIFGPKAYSNNRQPAWRWALHGRQAAGLMMTLYLYMSPKRRQQIKNALLIWHSRPARPDTRVFCKWNHEYTPENTGRHIGKHGSQRYCKQCARESKHRQKIRGSLCCQTAQIGCPDVARSEYEGERARAGPLSSLR